MTACLPGSGAPISCELGQAHEWARGQHHEASAARVRPPDCTLQHALWGSGHPTGSAEQAGLGAPTWARVPSHGGVRGRAHAPGRLAEDGLPAQGEQGSCGSYTL